MPTLTSRRTVRAIVVPLLAGRAGARRLPLSIIIFLVQVIVRPTSLTMAWCTGPGRGRVLVIVLAVVFGIALAVLVGLILFAIAINQAWSSG
jgi:hypothetical protein